MVQRCRSLGRLSSDKSLARPNNEALAIDSYLYVRSFSSYAVRIRVIGDAVKFTKFTGDLCIRLVEITQSSRRINASAGILSQAVEEFLSLLILGLGGALAARHSTYDLRDGDGKWIG